MGFLEGGPLFGAFQEISKAYDIASLRNSIYSFDDCLVHLLRMGALARCRASCRASCRARAWAGQWVALCAQHCALLLEHCAQHCALLLEHCAQHCGLGWRRAVNGWPMGGQHMSF
jgi:hypothetical protein